MVRLGLGQPRGALDKGKRLAEILEPIGPLDAGRPVVEFPIGRLLAEVLGFVEAQRRDTTAARNASLLGKRRGHICHLVVAIDTHRIGRSSRNSATLPALCNAMLGPAHLAPPAPRKRP